MTEQGRSRCGMPELEVRHGLRTAHVNKRPSISTLRRPDWRMANASAVVILTHQFGTFDILPHHGKKKPRKQSGTV